MCLYWTIIKLNRLMDHYRIKIPRVSVIMCVYNEPTEWIRSSVESILAQTFSDFEFLIIIDNPDNQDTLDLLKLYAATDERIYLICNDTNIGLTKSLNKGIKAAKGEYIARMDADDISLPERFAVQLDYMDTHPETIVCGTMIAPFGNVSKSFFNVFFEKDIDIRGQMFHNSGFAHPTVMIRAGVLRDNDIYYNENYKTAQDYELWCRLWDYGKFANIRKKLLRYRISSSQISMSKRTDQQSNRDIISKMNLSKWQQSMADFDHSDRTNRILNSYYQRRMLYLRPSVIKMLKFILSNKTRITYKEIIYLTYFTLKKTIKG